MKLRERIARFFDPPVVPKVRELIDQAETFGLSEYDLNNAREMLEVNEWGLGFDILVTQLYEYDIPITTEFIKLAEEVMNDMKIDAGEFNFIYKLPIRQSNI